MPRKASRFVIPLNEEEQENLRYLKDFGETRRIRQRAHAILLSDKGKTIVEIGEVFDVDRDTVTSWINRWEASGFMGLADEARSGAPPLLDASEQEKVLEFLQEHPHSPKLVLRRIEKELGKKISADTLRRIARKAEAIK